MHGVELHQFNGEEIEKLDSIDVGFSIDLLRFNRANEAILVSSKPIGKLALIKLTSPHDQSEKAKLYLQR